MFWDMYIQFVSVVTRISQWFAITHWDLYSIGCGPQPYLTAHIFNIQPKCNLFLSRPLVLRVWKTTRWVPVVCIKYFWSCKVTTIFPGVQAWSQSCVLSINGRLLLGFSVLEPIKTLVLRYSITLQSLTCIVKLRLVFIKLYCNTGSNS